MYSFKHPESLPWELAAATVTKGTFLKYGSSSPLAPYPSEFPFSRAHSTSFS